MLLTRYSRQRSYGVEVRAYGPNRESDGFICGHCGGEQDDIPPGRDPADLGALCNCCQQLICFGCRGKGCMPLELRLEQWERFNNGQKYLRRDRLFEIFQSGGGKIIEAKRRRRG
jgi:hypothetical protein